MVVIIVITFVVFNYEFRTSLLIGFVMAVLTYPIAGFFEKKIAKYLPKNALPLSAIISIIMVSAVTIVGANFIASQLVREIPKLAGSAYDTINKLPDNQGFLDTAQSYGLSKEFVVARVNEFNNAVKPARSGGVDYQYYLNQENLNRALNIGQQLFNIVFNQIVYLILFFLAWYNGLVFGKGWLEDIFAITPFVKSEKVSVLNDLKVGVRNVIYANLLSGLIHTAAGFVMMLIFGVENIFIISLIIFLIGFLPASPSELGYAIPITIIFTKNPAAAIVLAILAELLILWANYIFLPKIILSGNEGNPLFVVTSVLVGIEIFGIMGFIIGPVIMILVNTLMQILLKRVRNQSLDLDQYG